MTDTDLLIQNLWRENEAIHKCGSDWAYCDGQCTRCFKGTITTTNRTRVTKRYNGGESDNG